MIDVLYFCDTWMNNNVYFSYTLSFLFTIIWFLCILITSPELGNKTIMSWLSCCVFRVAYAYPNMQGKNAKCILWPMVRLGNIDTLLQLIDPWMWHLSVKSNKDDHHCEFENIFMNLVAKITIFCKFKNKVQYECRYFPNVPTIMQLSWNNHKQLLDNVFGQ